MGLYGKSEKYDFVKRLLLRAAAVMHDDLSMSESWEGVLGRLPERYASAYDRRFAMIFAVCLQQVAWKIVAPKKQRLACTAEELALGLLVEDARMYVEDCNEWLEDEDHERIAANGGEEEVLVRIDDWYEMAVEDMDIECLYDPSLDGIEDPANPINRQLRIANLDLKSWFKPFNPRRGDCVHPFTDDYEPALGSVKIGDSACDEP